MFLFPNPCNTSPAISDSRSVSLAAAVDTFVLLNKTRSPSRQVAHALFVVLLKTWFDFSFFVPLFPRCLYDAY